MAEYSAPPSVSYDPRMYALFHPYYLGNQLVPPRAQRAVPPAAMPSSMQMPPPPAPMHFMPNPPKVESPREMRNKAEKQRRDKLNQSISELASMVPPVVNSTKKIDKTGVLRFTAHYLRAHQYVFDPTPEPTQFTQSSTRALLSLLNGFLLTTTYRGLIVVVSQNINEYLGYTELDLLGKNVFSIIHEDDHELLKDQLMPRSQSMGHHGQLLMPSDQEGRWKVANALSDERRRFIVRFLKFGNRSEPRKYVTCHVEGSFRVSDRVLRGNNHCYQVVRRARARGENPCSSGNDVVFIGVVRPCTETFINESALESYRMEYRTRHSIDGEIIQCEQRIALVTGYMMSEVSGVNAMNFIHRDEVRWVIIALKEMYNQSQLFGESCYRLMTKNGQFIYMRTRGRLDVDASTRAVTSFVCTNTVVTEKEGKQLIRMMKERFTFQAHCEGHPVLENFKETTDSQALEDPRQLKKVILNMVTTLPPPEGNPKAGDSPTDDNSSVQKLSLIPPEKERIVSAIEKIYTVFRVIPLLRPSCHSKSPPPTNWEEPLQPNIQEQTPDAMTPTTERDEITESTNSNADLPSFNTIFQAQSFSDGECSTEEYSPVVTSDLSSVPTPIVSSSHEEMKPMNEALEGESTLPDKVFHNVAPNNVVPEPSVSGVSTAGVKRPSQFEDEKNASKKKASVANEEEPGSETLSLETFFDDEILNTHIQSAIDSLEENVDPSFSEFLNSSGEGDDIVEPAHTDHDEN